MCMMCGDTMYDHGFALVERPAHRLAGRFWDGAADDAETGKLPLIQAAKAVSAASTDLWKSPIVALTWHEAAGRARCFVGIETEDKAASEGCDLLDVPQMYCASAWHGSGDGAADEGFAALAREVEKAGIRRDPVCDRREEFAADIDLSKPLARRLLVPIRPDEG